MIVTIHRYSYISIDQIMTDDNNKVKAFASDDDLKSLGELLSNETSRKIITHLMNQEMYTNEIATKLDMRVSLVIHHLKKMENLGLLEITDKKIIRRGQKHRFFKMNFDIFITLNNTREEVKEKGILSRIFKEGLKFHIIGIAAITSFIGQDRFNTKNTWSNLSNVNEFSLELPLLIITIGLALVIIYAHIKNKKRK